MNYPAQHEELTDEYERDEISPGYAVERIAVLFKAAPTAATASQAQLEAGNYRKPKRRFQGLLVSIENREGSVRSGTGPGGKPWRTKMLHDYGYIRGSLGTDGDHVDCYLGPDEDAETAYVVHQRKAGAWDKPDEDKVMLGFRSEQAAKRAYLAHYDDPRFLGPITAMPMEEFKRKVLTSRGRMIKAQRRGLSSVINDLFSEPVQVSGYVKRDGTVVRPHTSHREKSHELSALGGTLGAGLSETGLRAVPEKPGIQPGDPYDFLGPIPSPGRRWLFAPVEDGSHRIEFAQGPGELVDVPADVQAAMISLARSVVSSVLGDQSVTRIVFVEDTDPFVGKGMAPSSNAEIIVRTGFLREWINSGVSDVFSVRYWAELLAHETEHRRQHLFQDFYGTTAEDVKRNRVYYCGKVYPATLPWDGQPWERDAIRVQGEIARLAVMDAVTSGVIDANFAIPEGEPWFISQIRHRETGELENDGAALTRKIGRDKWGDKDFLAAANSIEWGDPPGSEQFRKTIVSALAVMPKPVLKMLASNDRYHMKAGGDTLTTLVPRLKNSKPRGWGGFGWAAAGGICLAWETPCVSEFTFDTRLGRRQPSLERVRGTTWHEVGHSFDTYTRRDSERRSHSAAFRKAYRADVAAIEKYDRPAVKYFLQKGAAGPSEAFAESFAEIMAEIADAPSKRYFRDRFPRCIRHIKALIQEEIGRESLSV